MLGDLISPLTKGLLLATILAASLAAFTTKLYLSTRDELASLQSTYTQLKQVSKEQEEGKAKVVEGNKQDDSLLVDKTNKIDILNRDKESLLKQLAAIPKCSPTTIKGAQDVQVNIDSELPSAIVGLLNESYNQNKRSSNSTK